MASRPSKVKVNRQLPLTHIEKWPLSSLPLSVRRVNSCKAARMKKSFDTFVSERFDHVQLYCIAIQTGTN
jgi:hypothetical protein